LFVAFGLDVATCLNAQQLANTVLVWPLLRLQELEADMRGCGGASALVSLASLKEIWVYQQLAQSSQQIYRLTQCPKIRVVPHVWGPSMEREYDAPSRDSSGGIHVVVLTDGVSSTASYLTPLLICDAAEETAPGSLRSVTMWGHGEDSGAVASARAFPRLASKVHVVQMCDDVCVSNLLGSEYTVFLYTQTACTEVPEILWSLAYCGCPVYHNLKTTLAFGVKYNENDIKAAATLLTVSKDSFNAAYLGRNRASLRTLREAALHTVRHVLGLIQKSV
jgi:hypothetical protein